MSIYRRKRSPYWHYDFTVGGLRFRGSTQATEREQAKAIYARLRSEAVLGQHFPKLQPITISAAFARYYTEVAEHLPSASDTFRQLDTMEKFFGAQSLLSAVGDAKIAERIARRRADIFRGHLVSNATVNRETELLRRVYRRARDLWNADIGAMPKWPKLLLPESQGRTRSLSPDERTALLEAVAKKAPALLPALRFSMTTGLRLMNALSLRWGQIDFGTAKMTFRTKSKRPGGALLEIPITAPALVELANQKGLHPEFVFTYEVRKKRRTRLKGQRRPFTKTGWRKQWKEALAAAKIADFRWHDLRHTAATWALRETGNIALVRRMLGHADLKSTERYAHVLDRDLREGMEATARRILASPESEKPTKRLPQKGKAAIK